jgi:hypothetical protein
MQINALRIKVPVTRTEVKKDPKPSRRTQMLIFKHVIGTICSYTDQVIRGSLQRNKNVVKHRVLWFIRLYSDETK